MNRYWKILIPVLLAIALALGLIQRTQEPFNGNKPITKIQSSGNDLLGYYKQAQQLAAQSQPASATFLAVGDIMLSRNVALQIQMHKNNIDYPFMGMSDILKSTDFNFANFENPFSPTFQMPDGHSLIFGASADNVPALTDYNFKILNLANNHAFDQGLTGLQTTTKLLHQANIMHEGTGNNLDEAWMPAVVNSNGIKICFVGASYASVNDGGKTTNNYVARMEDAAHLKLAINQARTECDFVVATMHGGIEYTRTPDKTQTNFAHAAIDDGADIVIGAHPHWVQTIEKYCPNAAPPLPVGEDAIPSKTGEGSKNCPNPKYIFYSLGNFIFDQNFSQDTKEGLTLKIQLSKIGGCSVSPLLRGDAPSTPEGQRGCSEDLQGPRQPAKLDSIELIPVIIDNAQPRRATEAETKNILNKINQTQNIIYP